MTTEPDSGPAESVEDLRSEYEALHRELSHWQFHVGRLRVSGQFNSQRFARYFAGFHVLVLAVGATLIFQGGAIRDLGMALVVGALFGFGAFVGQVWAMQVDRERWLYEDGIRARVADLDARWERAASREGSQAH